MAQFRYSTISYAPAGGCRATQERAATLLHNTLAPGFFRQCEQENQGTRVGVCWRRQRSPPGLLAGGGFHNEMDSGSRALARAHLPQCVEYFCSVLCVERNVYLTVAPRFN